MKSQLLPTNPALGFSTAIIIAIVALLPGSCDAQSDSDSEMNSGSGSGGYNSYAYVTSGTCTGISGCALIDSRSECESANIQMGHPSRSAPSFSSLSSVPGCFGLRSTNGYSWALYFNYNMGATYTCSQSYPCLCKCTSGAAAGMTAPPFLFTGSDSGSSSGSGSSGYSTANYYSDGEYRSVTSGTCTDISGCAVIDSSSECRSASIQVGNTARSARDITSAGDVPGCWFLPPSFKLYWFLYFNSNMYSTATCSEDYQCICKCTAPSSTTTSSAPSATAVPSSMVVPSATTSASDSDGNSGSSTTAPTTVPTSMSATGAGGGGEEEGEGEGEGLNLGAADEDSGCESALTRGALFLAAALALLHSL